MAYQESVSVTIVTYNSGRYIKRCLESVLAQKGPHIEIIVVDNKSTTAPVTFWNSTKTAAKLS